MTEENIKKLIRKYVAEKIDRDTLNGKLSFANDAEIQFAFDTLTSGCLQNMKNLGDWYQALLIATDAEANEFISLYIEGVDKLGDESIKSV